MRTRSQARKRRQQQVQQTSVESSNLEKPDNPPIVTMADNRTLLCAIAREQPTEGFIESAAGSISMWKDLSLSSFHQKACGARASGRSSLHQSVRKDVRNEYYCFLDGFSGYFQIPIDPRDQEKTTFTCPYGTFAYRRMPFGLCNAPGTFQRCMLAIFHDMVEKTMEVFMDDFSVFGNSFENCPSRLEKMFQRCEDTNLCLNWEKSHFMVKEGIVLGHKISKNGIEVDKAKIDVIAKLPHPTTVKGVRSFLGHAGFYRRFIKDFSKISRPMTHLL
ncbi:reverse transcriptase domain-containing protein [Tanacetum coccineum]